MASFLLTHTVLANSLESLAATWPQAQMRLELPAGADCWHRFAQLPEPRLLVYPGSLGDPLAMGLTLADLAADWRLGLVLALPLDRPDSPSVAAAYSALVRQSRAHLVGFVGTGTGADPTEHLSVPYLGHEAQFSWSEVLATLPQTRG